MKKSKILSMFLAVVMILSCFTSAFAVTAVNESANVKDLIDAFGGDMTAAEPKQEDLSAYNNMVNAFNALSQDEKDSFDVFSFDKLLLAVYDRETALWKAENNSTSSANAYKAAHERAKNVITMPSYVDEAEALYTSANAISTQTKADAFIAQLASASKNAVILAGGYYSSYKLFRNSVSEKYGAELVDLAADKISAVTQKADDANKPVAPKSVSKPNPSKFPGGESDLDYIAAYEAYLQYKEAYADYIVAKYAFEGEKHYLPALKQVVDAASDFAYLYDIEVASIAAKRSFNADGDTSKIAEAVAIYNGLTDMQKAWLESVDNYVFGEKKVSAETDFGTEYGYSYYQLPNLIDFCKSMEFYYTVKDFEAVIDSISEPYTNQDIAKAKEAYNNIPKSLQSAIAPEATVKYKEILAAVGPDDASDEEPDLGAYPATDVSFADISKANAEMLANATIEVVLSAAGVSDTKELINTKVLTNQTIVSLAGLLYPLLDTETDGLISATPASLAKKLTEEKLAGAVEALTAAGEDWNAVEIKSGDFGFEDGDAEGFLDAASAMLRSASLIHMALKLENQKNTTNGTYTYGAYEELIEIFEILDLKAVMSSDEYTNYVNSAEVKNDAKFRAILAPIVYLLVDLGNDPVNTICDILPKAAYAIDSEIVNTRINNVIDKFTMVTIAHVDLTTAGIYQILSDKLLVPYEITLPEEDFTALIKALAGCGEAVSKPSVQRGQSVRMGIESDRAKTIVVLMSWILDEAAHNRALVNSLLDKVTDNVFLKAALKVALTASVTFIPRRVIFLIVSVLITLASVFSPLFNLKF